MPVATCVRPAGMSQCPPLLTGLLPVTSRLRSAGLQNSAPLLVICAKDRDARSAQGACLSFEGRAPKKKIAGAAELAHWLSPAANSLEP
jgi:hypothetical protein